MKKSKMSYKGLQARVYRMLSNLPWTRERRMKDKALVKLLTSHKRWDGDLCVFTLPELVDLVKDYSSADRGWRKILSENEDLRGEDYEDKTVLSQSYQIKNLGMEVGYHQDTKQ